MAMLEAMLEGVPVLTTTFCASATYGWGLGPHAVEVRDTGHALPVGDLDPLPGLGNPSPRSWQRWLGMHKYVQTNYDWDRIATET